MEAAANPAPAAAALEPMNKTNDIITPMEVIASREAMSHSIPGPQAPHPQVCSDNDLDFLAQQITKLEMK